MSKTGEPITRCPVCRYDLAGLPRDYRCPECGFEYDEAARLWNLRTVWFFVVEGVLLGGCLLVLVKVLARMVIVGVRPWEDLIGLVGVVVVGAMHIRLLMSPFFLVVARTGVLAGLPGGGFKRYSWDEVVLVSDRRVVARKVQGKVKPIALTSLLSRERRESLRATCLALKPVDSCTDACDSK